MRKPLILLAICFIFVTGTACGSTANPVSDGGPGSGTMSMDGHGMGLPGLSDAGSCSAAPDASMPMPPGATLNIDDPCTAHSQCTTGLCFPFNSKGPHCSAPCTEPCQCPGTTGCSNMGVCKAP